MSDQSQGPGWWQASDGKWYPPHQHPTAALPPTGLPTWAPTPPPGWGPPQQQGMNGCLKAFLIVLAIVAVLGVGLVIVGAVAFNRVSDTVLGDHPEVEDDASILSCGPNEQGAAEAKVQVTNDSTDRSNYIIIVAFESAAGGTRYGIGTEFLNLESGLNTVVIIEPDDDSTALPEGFRCEIDDVTRFSDEL